MIDVITSCIRADLKEKQDAKDLRERMLMLAAQSCAKVESARAIIDMAEAFHKYIAGEVVFSGSEIEHFPEVLKAWEEGEDIQAWTGSEWIDWNHSTDPPHVSGFSPWRIKP